jgi:hypothetical protein
MAFDEQAAQLFDRRRTSDHSSTLSSLHTIGSADPSKHGQPHELSLNKLRRMLCSSWALGNSIMHRPSPCHTPQDLGLRPCPETAIHAHTPGFSADVVHAGVGGKHIQHPIDSTCAIWRLRVQAEVIVSHAVHDLCLIRPLHWAR